MLNEESFEQTAHYKTRPRTNDESIAIIWLFSLVGIFAVFKNLHHDHETFFITIRE